MSNLQMLNTGFKKSPNSQPVAATYVILTRAETCTLK